MATEEIVGRLRLVRETARLTQAEMAAELGVKLPTYKKWEQGNNELPAAVYFALERTREINPTWLFSGEGPMTGRRRPARPIDDDQAEGIAHKVWRQFHGRMNDLDAQIEALKAAARRGADRAVANNPVDPSENPLSSTMPMTAVTVERLVESGFTERQAAAYLNSIREIVLEGAEPDEIRLRLVDSGFPTAQADAIVEMLCQGRQYVEAHRGRQ